MAGANIDLVGQYVDPSSVDKIDANTFASPSTPTTTTGKKEEGGAKKTKLLSYQLSRRDHQETDYLEIVIAENQAPGLELQGVTFTDLKSSGDSSNLKSTQDSSVLEFTKGTGKDKIKDENPSFALQTGSQSNRNKKIYY